MLLSLFTSILTIATHISPVTASPTKLYIDPDLVQKTPDDVCHTFNITIMIDDVSDLFGFDIKITWDNTLITYVADHYNKTLNGLWTAGNWYVAKNDTDAGWYKLVALSTKNGFTGGPQALFKVEFHVEKGCNFPRETTINFETHKLSDSAYTAIDHTTDDGLYKMSATIPDLEFEVYDPDTTKPFEYCKIFKVEVYVTHICADLEDYYLTILYDTELLKFEDVVDWGVLGGPSDGASYVESPSGTIQVQDTGGTVWSGDRGLLFSLTFHIEFDERIEHIWRTDSPHELKANVWFEETSAELSFVEGTITYPGIIMPSPLEITIYLIQGDVDCDGEVSIFDLRTVAAFYDLTEPAKYDIKTDGIIDIFDLVVAATNFGYADP